MPFVSTSTLIVLFFSIFTRFYLSIFINFVSIALFLPSRGEFFANNIPLIKAPFDFQVMNYNVGSFHLDRYGLSIDADTTILLDTVNVFLQNQWLDSLDADVLCFQEFYNNDFVNAESIISKLIKLDYKYYYLNPFKIPCYSGFFGVATFSKYPIIKSDSIFLGENTGLNRAIYTDIVIKNDTIRIINTHLHSMSIRFDANNAAPDSLVKQIRIIKRKLVKGFKEREKQSQYLIAFIKKSPYRTILAGDFNDVPFSFVYQNLKKQNLTNAFEQSGRGFGFSYNKFPWLIRIDNQFYSRGLKTNYSKILYNNRKSDHYPFVARYLIE
jgi:endonuclease/exonuclease/phosphatase family metal-dependent hydrolase